MIKLPVNNKQVLQTKEALEKKYGKPADEFIEHLFSIPDTELTTDQRKCKLFYLAWVRDMVVTAGKELEKLNGPSDPKVFS